MQGDDLRQSETFLQLAGIHELASNEAMTPQLLALIRCPQCREGNLKVVGGASGELICRCCATNVAVVDGVPRFAGTAESYAASFGRQWNRYDVARPEEDDATFRVKTGASPLTWQAGWYWTPAAAAAAMPGWRAGEPASWAST